ncbi:hypothetical protein [Arthrobacter sp. SLBN-53]|uniref:hypothetical protein n=1 Tax=Arthrobacter sp. SLBN-53 TaxID=2768412 RepID=UPI001153ED64|nr:hypothetical protein [Arthrobacter sp. SLBN-53]TQK29830.1 hypothetical protein FBY28_2841 [Arthrobacter sp. SLBN-53]
MPTEPDDATTAWVRRELADLTEAPAPAPPPEVTAAVVAALRGNHRVVPGGEEPLRHADRPSVHRRTWQFGGLLAVGVAIVLGSLALPDTEPRPATGTRADYTTARQLTEQSTPSGLPLPSQAIAALLIRPPVLGPLMDTAACLTGIGRPADTPILGAQPVPDGVLLVLPGTTPDELVAVVVADRCPATNPRLLTSSVLPRPSHAAREHRGLR